MSWFGKKNTMNDEFIDENEDFQDEEINVTDKRRINITEDGEVINNVKSADREVKTAAVIKLENELRDERTRREAAEAKLVGVQAKFDEAKNAIERETAEMRERMRKTLEECAKQGQSNFLMTLLPVLDNLNLAIDAAEKDASFEKLIGGVKGTAKSFENALQGVGAEAVPSVGVPFNPEFHEAIDMIEVTPEKDGLITAEYSRGYKFGEKLLRPARVQVGKGI